MCTPECDRRPRRAPRVLAGPLLAAGLLAGLAPTASAQYRRFYSGPPLPRGEVAFVVAVGGTRLDEIDKTPLLEGNFFTLRSRLPAGGELLPGDHEFCVAFSVSREDNVSAREKETETHYAKCERMSVILLPGQIYLFRPRLASGAFKPELRAAQDRDAGAAVSLPRELQHFYWQTRIELPKELERIDKYFRGERKPSEHAAQIVQAQAGRESETAQVSQAWDQVNPGCVVELLIKGKTLVAVVDKLKPDKLVYYAIGDPDNTYAVWRSDVTKLTLLAASVEEYQRGR